MAQRVGTQGLAVLAVIAVPLLVIARDEEKAPAPKPEETALTLRLEGTEGGSQPKHFRLSAVGEPPAVGEPFTLRDTEGLHSATAAAAAETGPECESAELRTTGLETESAAQEWCVKLTSVDEGHEMSGSVAGSGATPGTILGLTVTKRHEFWDLPAVVLGLGLLFGLALGLAPGPVKEWIRRLQLSWAVWRNGEGEKERIKGLGTWVAERREAGVTAADLAPRVRAVVKEGTKSAERLRAKLGEALDAAGLPAELPFAVAARRAARARTDAREDFLTEAGKPAVHPATGWIGAVTKVRDARKRLDREEEEIGRLPPPLARTPRARLAEARATIESLESAADAARVDPRLTALRTAVENAQARGAAPRTFEPEGLADGTGDVLSQAFAEAPVPVVVVTRPARERPSGPELFARALVLGAVTLAVAAVTLVVGWLAVQELAYNSNHTFADKWDYLALWSAASTSGAIAGLLAVVGWWQLKPSAPAD